MLDLDNFQAVYEAKPSFQFKYKIVSNIQIDHGFFLVLKILGLGNLSFATPHVRVAHMTRVNTWSLKKMWKSNEKFRSGLVVHIK